MNQTIDLSKRLIRRIVPSNYLRFLRQAYEEPEYAWLHFKKEVLKERLVVIVGSAHRVGSTWLFYMLKELGRFKCGGVDQVPAEFMAGKVLITLKPEIFEYMNYLTDRVIFKTHSLPLIPEIFANSVKFVSIYRDPRDVLVSASFFVAYLEEEEGGWGEEFRSLPETERIKTVIEKGDFLLLELEQWFRTPFAYKVRYEDVRRQPVETLQGISKSLGLAIHRKAIEKVVLERSFKSMTGRKPGEERKEDFRRKGIVGDWRNYFDRECIVAFKTAKKGRWNQLLVEMGYENTLDWE